MRRLLSFALALATIASGQALACPCSDDPESALVQTSSTDTFALSLLATSRHALGVFDARAAYHALPAGERLTSEELLLRGALRLNDRLETQAEFGAASYRFHGAEVWEAQTGLGDVIARLRYQARDEAMPHRPFPWPSMVLGLMLRAPLGDITQARTSGFGSGGAQLGLGAWEAGTGVDAARRLAGALVWASAEAAYRFADHRLGPARKLGPRLDLAGGLRLPLSERLSLNAALSWRTTGDVRFSGHRLAGSAERITTLTSGVTFRPTPHMRTGVTLSIDPPLAGWSKNAVASSALVVSAGISD